MRLILLALILGCSRSAVRESASHTAIDHDKDRVSASDSERTADAAVSARRSTGPVSEAADVTEYVPVVVPPGHTVVAVPVRHSQSRRESGPVLETFDAEAHEEARQRAEEAERLRLRAEAEETVRETVKTQAGPPGWVWLVLAIGGAAILAWKLR